jgi:hypothetical protein
MDGNEIPHSEPVPNPKAGKHVAQFFILGRIEAFIIINNIRLFYDTYESIRVRLVLQASKVEGS